MDWHKLQQTLFALDPTDPREDLAKLQAAAQGGSPATPKETVDYLNESAAVPEGSLAMDRDYSVADFAALAGVRIDERQKHGDYARGSDPMPKAKPGRTKHPLKDKLVGEEEEVDEDFKSAFQAGRDQYNKLGAVTGGAAAMGGDTPNTKPAPQKPVAKPKPAASALPKELAQYEPQLMSILNNPRTKAAFERFLNTYAPKKEQTIEAVKKPMPKPRDPSSQYMQDLRKSGAMGSHGDKKKDAKSGKVKHKGKQYESIKDMLYAKLAEKK